MTEDGPRLTASQEVHLLREGIRPKFDRLYERTKDLERENVLLKAAVSTLTQRVARLEGHTLETTDNVDQLLKLVEVIVNERGDGDED